MTRLAIGGAFASLLVPACYCSSPAPSPAQALLSNRPIVVVDADGGTRFGIADQLEGGLPLALNDSTSLQRNECYSELEIDQRFGARCARSELQTAPLGALGALGAAQRAEAAAARWYCSDEWLTRVLLAPCNEPAASARPGVPSFKIVQIALRSLAKLP